jgi:hypothetical protein
MKVALAELEGMTMVAGMVMLPVATNETVAAAATGPLSVIVQTEGARGASVDGLQPSPLRSGVPTVLAVPPLAAMLSALPSRVAPNAPETPIVAEPTVVANLSETVPTIPSGMRFVLMPKATQVYAAGEPAHSSILLAVANAGPGVMLKLETAAAG